MISIHPVTMDAQDARELGLDAPQTTKLSILEPQQATLTTPAERMLANAEALVIDSPEMADTAGDELKAIKRKYNDLEAQRKDLVRPLDEHRARLMDLFRKPLSLLERAEAAIKRSLIAYNTKVDEERRREEARLADIARKEQARINEQARKAEASGKIEKAETLRDQAAALPTAVVLPPAPKVAGVHGTVTYDAECDSLLELARFVVANPIFLNCIEVNQTSLRQQARSMKEAFAIGGCRLVKKAGISARA